MIVSGDSEAGKRRSEETCWISCLPGLGPGLGLGTSVACGDGGSGSGSSATGTDDTTTSGGAERTAEARRLDLS